MLYHFFKIKDDLFYAKEIYAIFEVTFSCRKYLVNSLKAELSAITAKMSPQRGFLTIKQHIIMVQSQSVNYHGVNSSCLKKMQYDIARPSSSI